MNREYKKEINMLKINTLSITSANIFVTSDAEIIFEKCFDLNK